MTTKTKAPTPEQRRNEYIAWDVIHDLLDAALNRATNVRGVPAGSVGEFTKVREAINEVMCMIPVDEEWL